MKKISAALPLFFGTRWTANTFVDGQPNVSETTRQHEREAVAYQPSSWRHLTRIRIAGNAADPTNSAVY